MPKSRVARVILLTSTGIVGAIAFAVLAASVVLQGPRLGHLIEGALPANAGKISLGGIEWHLRALLDIITDVPSPVAVDGLKIVDPEGTVVLDVPHLDARIKLRTLIGGGFSIHDLRVPKVLWRFAALEHGEGIGFLAALGPKVPPPPPPKDAPPAPGGFFEIASAELGDLDAIFDFPGSWGLELRHTHARASLIQSSLDPKHPVFGFDAGPIVSTGGGYLKILDDNVLPFDRVVINRVATTAKWSDDIFLDLQGAETGKSTLVAKGFFTGIYGATSVAGIKLKGDFTRAGDAFAAVAAGRKIDGLTVGDGGSPDGAGARATVVLGDTFAKLKVKARFDDLDVAFDTNRALGIGFDLGFDAEAGKVDVTKLGFGAPGGGRLGLDAHLDTNRLALDAAVRLEGFHTESYVPSPLRALAGGQLDGRLDATANLGHQSARVRRLDLRLARARAGGLPRVVRVHGDAYVSPEVARTDGLTVAVTGAEATAKGRVLLTKQVLELGLDVVAADLARLLAELGLPPLAKSARVTASARGTFEQPEATGEAVVDGIAASGRSVKELKARFGLKDGIARLDSLSGAAFGGTLGAQGTLRLWQKRASKPLRSPEVDLALGASGLELAALAGSDVVGGRLSFSASARGPLDRLTASLRVPAGTKVTVGGAPYSVGPIDVALKGDTLEVRALHVAQPAGGMVDVTGRIGVKHQDLDLFFVLTDVPLESLPGLADAGVPVTGRANARLKIGGRPERPEVAGTLDLTDVVARGIALGPAHLTFAPARVGARRVPGVSVVGELFSRFHVEAEAALVESGPLAHGLVSFQRVALDPLLPELAAFGDGRGVVSGRVIVDVEPRKPLALDVLLSELWLSIARSTTGESGETIVQRVRVEATSPLHVTVKGDHVALDKVTFATDG
ncbi:MAG TPA: hypothetical protein VG319_11990, partial [Polyangia bacterium]|nr:hypothetical protein [Polyangia bacterium]